MACESIKVCPFCGEFPTLENEVLNGWTLFCCMGIMCWGETREEAIASWNTRKGCSQCAVDLDAYFDLEEDPK